MAAERTRMTTNETPPAWADRSCAQSVTPEISTASPATSRGVPGTMSIRRVDNRVPTFRTSTGVRLRDSECRRLGRFVRSRGGCQNRARLVCAHSRLFGSVGDLDLRRHRFAFHDRILVGLAIRLAGIRAFVRNSRSHRWRDHQRRWCSGNARFFSRSTNNERCRGQRWPRRGLHPSNHPGPAGLDSGHSGRGARRRGEQKLRIDV